jgi:hypothetical protein
MEAAQSISHIDENVQNGSLCGLSDTGDSRHGEASENGDCCDWGSNLLCTGRTEVVRSGELCKTSMGKYVDFWFVHDTG